MGLPGPASLSGLLAGVRPRAGWVPGITHPYYPTRYTHPYTRTGLYTAPHALVGAVYRVVGTAVSDPSKENLGVWNTDMFLRVLQGPAHMAQCTNNTAPGAY